jgi:hypothetical protein
MGWPSYFEDIEERRYNNQIALGAYEGTLNAKPKPVNLAISPPLQARMLPTKPDVRTIAKRTNELHEKHVLALLELMPGKRWRQ